MAFSNIEHRGGVRKLYTGVGTVKVLAVNPTREESNKIFGGSDKTDPIVYVKEYKNRDGKLCPGVRISFITKTIPDESNGIDTILPISFMLYKRTRISLDETKVQVIDKYGRTGWVTKEQYQKHEVPIRADGRESLDKEYHPCYQGEEELIKFLKAYLAIEGIEVYNRDLGIWELNKHPERCLCSLDNTDKLFEGDFSEVKAAIGMKPDNTVKVLFGVRTDNDGNNYQDFYSGYFMTSFQRLYNSLNRSLDSDKKYGKYPDTEFTVVTLKEWVKKEVEKQETVDDLPFGDEPEGLDNPWGV